MPAVFELASQLLEPGVDAQAEVLGQRCGLVRLEEMEFEVAADAEPDQLVRVELRRDTTLVEAEQVAVKRAPLVAAAGRGRDRDVLELQPHGSHAIRLPVHDQIARTRRATHASSSQRCRHMLGHAQREREAAASR